MNFVYDYLDNISSEKRNLKVVIFGPYKNNSLTKLVKLRDYLIQKGYVNSEIVINLPDPPGLSKQGLAEEVYWYKRSVYWLEQSDVNLFAFLNDVELDSVVVEMVEAVVHFKKLCCTTFLIEKGSKLASLVTGFLKSHRCNVGYFNIMNDLYKKSLNACWNHIVEDGCTSNAI